MTQTIEGRRVADSQGRAFMEELIATYERDGARDICAALISSLADAQQGIPLIRPVRGLELEINEDQGTGRKQAVQPFLSGYLDAIKLVFHPEYDAAEIVRDLPYAAWHETGHIAHYQHNGDFDRYRPRSFWFDEAIKEGVAEHIQYLGLEPGYSADFGLRLRLTEARLLEDGVRELLDESGDNQGERHYEFLFGNDVFPNKGYRLGHFIVANAVLYREYDLVQLLELPFDDFRHFAEHEL